MNKQTGPQGPHDGVQGITEGDIANFLAQTPGFFERHAELLSSIQLTSPHGNRAVSLQERQMEMLRERIKGLELKFVELIRNGQDNVTLADHLYQWARELLQTAAPAALPQAVSSGLEKHFMVPQCALRLWGLGPRWQDAAFVQGVSDDAKLFASSLMAPYCGANVGFEPVQWLADAAQVQSMALVPLRCAAAAGGAAGAHDATETFGLLVLASPDPTRYRADMGTEFLQRVGELASAALARLREV